MFFIHFWLCWVFVPHGLFSSGKRGLLGSCSVRASHCGGFSCCRVWALGHVGFSSSGSWALEHRLNSCGSWLGCSTPCGIFPDQRSNPCLLHWQMDSLLLSHQGCPKMSLIVRLSYTTEKEKCCPWNWYNAFLSLSVSYSLNAFSNLFRYSFFHYMSLLYVL